MKRLIICSLLGVATISSCTKLHEEIYDEHIQRPQIDIEVEQPQWDSTPGIDSDLEFELK
ncbi:MAG: hypothetical protein SNG38_08895 [Rikenellaceae bacterium]